MGVTKQTIFTHSFLRRSLLLGLSCFHVPVSLHSVLVSPFPAPCLLHNCVTLRSQFFVCFPCWCLAFFLRLNYAYTRKLLLDDILKSFPVCFLKTVTSEQFTPFDFWFTIVCLGSSIKRRVIKSIDNSLMYQINSADIFFVGCITPHFTIIIITVASEMKQEVTAVIKRQTCDNVFYSDLEVSLMWSSGCGHGPLKALKAPRGWFYNFISVGWGPQSKSFYISLYNTVK